MSTTMECPFSSRNMGHNPSKALPRPALRTGTALASSSTWAGRCRAQKKHLPHLTVDMQC
eukprot:8386391-Pyramimonas_sp.AAC.1